MPRDSKAHLQTPGPDELARSEHPHTRLSGVVYLLYQENHYPLKKKTRWAVIERVIDLFIACGGMRENNQAKRDCLSEDLPPLHARLFD